MTDDNATYTFLSELYTATQGDPDAKISMYDLGARIGMENDVAGEVAQDLCIQGFAELKTLSGDIGITPQGLKELNISSTPASELSGYAFGSDPVLDKDGSGYQAVIKITEEIKEAVAVMSQPYSGIEELVMDIKTIEIQLLSPRPKVSIIRETFRSLLNLLKDQGGQQLIEKLETLIES